VRVLKRRGGGLPAPVALDLHGMTPVHVRIAPSSFSAPDCIRLLEAAT